MKTIYIFTNSYKPVLGGIQTVTSQLAESLYQQKKKVAVITKFGRKSYLPFTRISNVPVFRFLFESKAILPLLYLLFFLKRPEIVYVHFPQEQAWFITKLRRHFKFRLITCFHGHDVMMYEEGFSKSNKLYEAKKNLVHLSDAVTACSEFLGNKVKETFECNEVTAIYNGVDLSRFLETYEPPESKFSPYLFAFGRLEKIKGYDLLIDAFAQANISSNIHLIIAGEGSQKESLSERINDLGFSSRIHLVGRLLPTEIARYSTHAEINIIPSLREPFGIVVLEAIAAGKPVIATNRGGIPEIMSSDFGILCEPTVADLTRAIEQCIDTPEIINRTKAIKYINRFSIQRMVDNYLAIGNK